MDHTDIDAIIEKALENANQLLVDGDLINDQDKLSQFIFDLVQGVFAGEEVLRRADGNYAIASIGAVLDANNLVKGLRPTSPGPNRDLIVEFLDQMISKRDILLEHKQFISTNGIDLESLVLVPKTIEEIEGTEKEGQKKSEGDDYGPPVFSKRKAIGHVYSVLALNGKNHVSYLLRDTLKDLGLGEAEMHDRALQNIEKMAMDVKIEFDEDGLGIIDESQMKGLASSLILVPGFWKAVAAVAGEDIFVHVSTLYEVCVVKASKRDVVLSLIMAAATGKTNSLLPATFFTHDQDGFRLFADARSRLRKDQ